MSAFDLECLPMRFASASRSHIGSPVLIGLIGLSRLALGVHYLTGIEPPRVLRRLFGLSHAAMAGCSSMA